MDYRYVEKLFDMLVEYFHNKPPPEEHDGRGEWVSVRDGLQGAEHCIRVLTPEEFEDWHRAIEMPIQVEFGRRPVAFCSHEGQWWVIYDDTEENEVIAAIREVFRGAGGRGGGRPDFDVEQQVEISGFFGMTILLARHASPPAAVLRGLRLGQGGVQHCPGRLLHGYLPPRALALVTEWATLHEKRSARRMGRPSGRPRAAKIEPLGEA